MKTAFIWGANQFTDANVASLCANVTKLGGTLGNDLVTEQVQVNKQGWK